MRKIMRSEDSYTLAGEDGRVALVRPTYFGLRTWVCIYRSIGDALRRRNAIEDKTLWTPWAAEEWAKEVLGRNERTANERSEEGDL